MCVTVLKCDMFTVIEVWYVHSVSWHWSVLCYCVGVSGRCRIVKCLVDVRRLFIETGDQRYVLNDLYIDDYCAWTQHIRFTLSRSCEVRNIQNKVRKSSKAVLMPESQSRCSSEDHSMLASLWLICSILSMSRKLQTCTFTMFFTVPHANFQWLSTVTFCLYSFA